MTAASPTLLDTAANQAHVRRLRAALEELLARALVRGFHGAAALEFVVQDGTIQLVRRRVEQAER